MHKWLTTWRTHQQRNLLSYRLLVHILLCSTLLTILSSGIQLYWDYRNDVSDINKEIHSIEIGYLDSLASSLWKLDQEQIDIQLDGIMKVPDIEYAKITEIVAGKPGNAFSRGNASDEYPISSSFELHYRDTLVGHLELAATLDNVYERLFNRFLVILASQAVKTFLVSIFILVIVHYLIVRHLNTLRRFTRRLDLTNLDEHLHLQKQISKSGNADAIDQLVNSINEMRDNISNQLAAKRSAQKELQSLNEELEQRVLYRTATLKHTNERLTEALGELTETKDRLVETEKMAALGQLVSGVSQEISTPVKSSLKALQNIQQEVQQLDGNSTSEQLEQLKSTLSQATHTIDSNLNKASKLISTFKQVAVDQSAQDSQRFNILNNVQNAVAELSRDLEAANCQVTIDCPAELEIISFPETFGQIYQNLIHNSLVHGFENREKDNTIQINMQRQDGQLQIDYFDNGKGIPEQIMHRIFDPFVTGKPGHGSGLGTHLVYNLVTQLLQGTIKVESERGQGTHFIIRIPTQPGHAKDDHVDHLW